MRWLLIGCLLAGCKPHASPPRDAAPPGPSRGGFDLTYYWMSTPRVGNADTALYATNCRVLAKVSAAYAKEMTESGNGRLPDGRTLVVSGDCACARSPCFRDESQNLWGTGAGNRPLIPFRSIAVDRSVIPLGTRLYIEELDGIAFPDTALALHDGCVSADDTGGKIVGAKLDFFVGDEAAYHSLDHLNLGRVTVHDAGARCP